MGGMPPVLSRPGYTGPPCQKSQNIGVDQNLGATQEITVFGQSLSLQPRMRHRIENL
jgi:hypothetical protein